MAAIAPFHVMELLARAQALESQGRSIIHMEVGEPDFATAEPIIAAGQRALSEGRTRYRRDRHSRTASGYCRLLPNPPRGNGPNRTYSGHSRGVGRPSAGDSHTGQSWRTGVNGRPGLSLQPSFRAFGGG